jgi:hypothetical protein
LNLSPLESQETKETPKVTIKETIAPQEPKEKRLVCKGCNVNENITLAFFQDHGVKDKNALATIMGNIKQESMFVPNICEGGFRTSYRGCGRGYGLIQFTSASRYYGLGTFANRIGGNPSGLHTQLKYIVYEPQWRNIEWRMKTPGKSIDRYMSYAHSWLGWVIHGNRTYYAYNYAKRMTYTT